MSGDGSDGEFIVEGAFYSLFEKDAPNMLEKIRNRRGWINLIRRADDIYYPKLLKKFYEKANVGTTDDEEYIISCNFAATKIIITANTLASHFGIPRIGISNPQPNIFRDLHMCNMGSEANKRKDAYPVANMPRDLILFFRFYCRNIAPTTHTTNIYMYQLGFMYHFLAGVSLDICEYMMGFIVRSIKDSKIKKAFPCLISDIIRSHDCHQTLHEGRIIHAQGKKIFELTKKHVSQHLHGKERYWAKPTTHYGQRASHEHEEGPSSQAKGKGIATEPIGIDEDEEEEPPRRSVRQAYAPTPPPQQEEHDSGSSGEADVSMFEEPKRPFFKKLFRMVKETQRDVRSLRAELGRDKGKGPM